jgi:hypothetical protein
VPSPSDSDDEHDHHDEEEEVIAQLVFVSFFSLTRRRTLLNLARSTSIFLSELVILQRYEKWRTEDSDNCVCRLTGRMVMVMMMMLIQTT